MVRSARAIRTLKRVLLLGVLGLSLNACAVLEEDTPLVVTSANTSNPALTEVKDVKPGPVRPVIYQPSIFPGEPQPPLAQVKPSVLIAQHGATREDAFFWLGKRKDPEVSRYLEAENAYADQMMAHTGELQRRLREEVRARIPVQHEVPAYKQGQYYVFERYAPGADYPTITRRKGSLTGPEEVLADFNEIGPKHQQFLLQRYATSANGRIFAYSADHEGDRLHTIYFKDTATGEMLKDQLKFVAPDFVLSADGSTVFYIKLQRGTLRSAQVFRHKLGTDPKSDQEVYSENDERFDLSLRLSKGGRYVVITSEQTLTTEVRLIPADQPTAPAQIVRPRERGTRYFVDEVGGTLYIRTNKGAPDYKIVKASTAQPAQWRDVVPHTPGNYIAGFTVTSKFIAVDEYVRGSARIRVGSFATGKERMIALDEPGGYAAMSNDDEFPDVRNTDPDTGVLRYAYSSIATPLMIYDFDTATGKKTELVRTTLPGYDPNAYAVSRVFASAEDGQQIPVTLAYRRDLQQPGGNPLLLEGYGAYGITYDPVFAPDRASLMDRGWVVAIAHVRGGREMGQAWYEMGRLRNKGNTFKDFIAAAEHLAKTGVADRSKMFAEGRSAGGLLIGAVVNMRPDLFRGVKAGVPFVDVVSTMLDSSLPLTTFEFDEWGNPEEADDYTFMLSYSPYDNVTRKEYPSMLVTAGFNDTQVGYQEPAKWVAKLRVTKSDRNALLLRTNMGAGHAGDSGRFGTVEQQAFGLAFFIDQAQKEHRGALPSAAKPTAQSKQPLFAGAVQ